MTVRRFLWILGVLLGVVALAFAAAGYMSSGEVRMDLLAIGFVLIVVGFATKP